MAFVPITNGCKVVETFYFGGAFYGEMVWGVAISATLNSTLAGAINAQFDDFYNGAHGGATLKSGIANDVSIGQRQITDVRTSTGPQFNYSPGISGTDTTDPLPHGTCLKMGLYAGLRGRAYRGSKYLLGMTEQNSTALGQPDAGLLTVGLTALENLRDDLASAGTPLAILSRSTGVAQPVINVNLSTKWHYQRRRARA